MIGKVVLGHRPSLGFGCILLAPGLLSNRAQSVVRFHVVEGGVVVGRHDCLVHGVDVALWDFRTQP